MPKASPTSMLNTKLQLKIDEKRREVGGRDILTRSQAALSDLVAELAALEDERGEIVGERDQCGKNIVDLTMIYDKLDDQVTDIDALIAAKRNSVHALESAGVKLPLPIPPSAPMPDEAQSPFEHQLTDTMRNALAPQGMKE